MRKNFCAVVVATLALLSVAACRDPVRDVGEPPTGRLAEEPAFLPSAEASTGLASIVDAEVAGPTGLIAVDRAPEIEKDPTGAVGPPAPGGSVVLIPIDELFPPDRDSAGSTFPGPGVGPTVEAGAVAAAGSPAGSAPAMLSGGSEPLPVTPSLPPAEALPVTVSAMVPAGAASRSGAGGSEAGGSGGGGSEAAPGAGAPAELRVTLAAGEDVPVFPGSVLELSSPIALVDFRVRLFDENDRLVPSRDRVTVGKGTEVRIVPETPLPPGSAFRLEIGGQLQAHPTGIGGAHFAGRTYRFHTTGEKPPPPPPPVQKQRRRR